MPIGLLVAPGWWPVWAVCGGIAQGGGITVIFIAVVTLAVGVADNRAVSAFVQGGGYVVGATGPFLLGAAHDLTDGWSVPLIIALAALLGMAVLGFIATDRGSEAAAEPIKRR